MTPVSEERLTHLDARGRARMVDVGAKTPTAREATASARVILRTETADLLAAGALPKGDALAVARVAGIMAAKQTPALIPLCHTVALAAVEVDVAVRSDPPRAEITATVRAADRTGVEMEALVAASTAALALYDMIKAVDRGAVIERVQLEHKAGGVRGEYRRDVAGRGDAGDAGPADG
ncbi:MAG TPA: cyclic pyranopterin monophosphate synthase MoaC [Euzebyales bacterium]|nr:cyclic pyranopterin monophosphate synthase MoaC [Euzebyales bacterium]